ncbi:MAG: bifunctional glycosyltransferase family 2/GtrA family protein [Eubacterium sp.]|nr:bifunctional glycosyltransferase family 2/GtrA family protein [Eubacterium sp.]
MANYLKHISIVIPALNPDERLVKLVKDLRQAGFESIILVDDGSEIKNRKYFKTCKKEYGCKLIRHTVNFGKGMALKSAFNHILKNCDDIIGTVTVDCDGQHVVNDIITCAKLVEVHQDSLILGCRTFDDKEIPLRSRFGNVLTRKLINLLCGIKVSDTQTGLRGIPRSLLKKHFANTKGERFEYEMNMLICANEQNIPIIEFGIETIYLANNESSHFNPFLDSIRIYKTFLKFMLSSLSSFIIDIILFYIMGAIFRFFIGDKASLLLLGIQIPWVTFLRSVTSRLGSSLFNFTMNKRRVFTNESSDRSIIVKYYILCITQLLISTVLVEYAFTFIFARTIRKCIIDTILFVVSFQIQREWVFKKK